MTLSVVSVVCQASAASKGEVLRWARAPQFRHRPLGAEVVLRAGRRHHPVNTGAVSAGALLHGGALVAAHGKESVKSRQYVAPLFPACAARFLPCRTHVYCDCMYSASHTVLGLSTTKERASGMAPKSLGVGEGASCRARHLAPAQAGRLHSSKEEKALERRGAGETTGPAKHARFADVFVPFARYAMMHVSVCLRVTVACARRRAT